MAALQLTIPFKSQKKTGVRSSRSKLGIENQDILNIGAHTKSKLKRQQDKPTCDISDDECSPTKITRKSIGDSIEQLTDAVKDLKSSSPEVEPPKPLTSREKEIEYLESFLMDHLKKEESASLYISGQPGTGKTASLSYIFQLPRVQDGYKQIYVNCTMMKSASSIYDRISKELQIKTTGTTEKTCLSAIEKYLTKKHKMILLVLDEIDQLDSKRQSVLYTIFEWPALQGSRLVLIGVANALDLTERTLPRLQTRCSLKPQTLHFAPYSKEQIISIFTRVLVSEDKTKVFSPVALQMLAAKIAAVSGDMRRALDIGRRVIDVAKRSRFAENQSVDSMINHSTVSVELKQVLEVLNNVYGGSSNIGTDVDEAFPMQQKLILCSLMLLISKGKNKDILMGKLHDVYKRVANARNIVPLGLSEMASACALLEARGAVRVADGGAARGAVRVAGGGAARARRVRLQWDEAELAAALRDKPLLSAILADVSCLRA